LDDDGDMTELNCFWIEFLSLCQRRCICRFGQYWSRDRLTPTCGLNVCYWVAYSYILRENTKGKPTREDCMQKFMAE